jgi:hypothetical protein
VSHRLLQDGTAHDVAILALLDGVVGCLEKLLKRRHRRRRIAAQWCGMCRIGQLGLRHLLVGLHKLQLDAVQPVGGRFELGCQGVDLRLELCTPLFTRCLPVQRRAEHVGRRHVSPLLCFGLAELGLGSHDEG